MKTAISTVCMTEQNWQEAFAEAGKAGYKYVELLVIPNWHHVQPGQVPPDEMIERARQAGVTIMGLHAGAIDGSSDAALADSAMYIERVLNEAALLGVELVVFTGMPTPEGPDAPPRSAIHERMARGLKTFQPKLDRENIRIGLENHYRCQIETLEDYIAIFDGLGEKDPHIGATIDTGHFTASGVNPADVITALGDRVTHVHIKDHIGTRSVALGQGQTDNRAVVQALRKTGYHAWLTVELEVEDRQNALQYVRESHAYIEQLLGNGR